MLVGTFIKTPAPHIAEILALAGLDFGVIDAEHGPFDRTAADQMMFGGRAGGLPLFIRVPNMDASTLLWALDIGSDGLVVPHVDTAGQAIEMVACARFHGGKRGFSNSARFGRYGTTDLPGAMALGDRARLFCQIESGEAVGNAAAIADVAGVAGLVVGRADLALSLGETRLDAPVVLDGTRTAIAAARAAGKDAVIVTGRAAEAAPFIDMGATMVIVASDQSFMRVAAQTAAADVRQLSPATAKQDQP